MRNLVWAIALMFACGPSIAEIKTARQTTYRAPAGKILDLAIEAAQQNYKITQVSREEEAFVTQPRWYSPEGDLESPGAGGFLNLVDRSVEVGFEVKVVEAGSDEVAVAVTAKSFQFLKGSPQPRELAQDDPNLPPWVLGRVDALVLAIYDNAKGFAVASPGQAATSP
jgi:hypothetical protein